LAEWVESMMTAPTHHEEESNSFLRALRGLAHSDRLWWHPQCHLPTHESREQTS
jgi:hypothetical protein